MTDTDQRPMVDRVAGARLVVAANKKLGQPTPEWIRKLAETPEDQIRYDSK